MRNDNSFAIIACICMVLLSTTVGIAFYQPPVDWERISGICFGFYLFFTYLLFSIIFGRSKNQVRNFQGKSSHGKNQKVSINEAYEF